MKNYQNLLKKILEKGTKRNDRTGTGTISLFGEQLKFDLSKGFPLVTTKQTFWKGIVHELIWTLSGNTNINYLKDNGVNIWNEWADENGELGLVYGKQWRDFNSQGIDQISNVIYQIKNNPYSRRHLVVTYNPAQVDKMALPPCPAFFQFYVSNGKLSMHLYQRSADMFLGVPFDIAVYAALTHLIAKVCKLDPGKLIISYGDVHIYNNHIDQVKLQLTRKPFPLPKLVITKDDNIFNYKAEDLKLFNYKYHERIKGSVSV